MEFEVSVCHDLLKLICGGEENSYIDRFGGEWITHEFTRGPNNGPAGNIGLSV